MNQVNELVDDKKLIEILLQFQKSNRYSNEEMAKRIGCARQTYGRVLKGNGNESGNGKVTASPEFLWKAMKFIWPWVNGQSSSVVASGNNNGKRSFPIKRETRQASIPRKTRETDISLELNVDGCGKGEVKTGVPMFDHLLEQVARHGVFDIKLSATGDDPHHLVEDVAICMGQALNEALGKKRGIVRMADATVPMDDALAMVAMDISGRGYTVLELSFSKNDMAGFSTDLIRHFLETFATEAKLNLHARVIYGVNDHHKAEALFKAFGRALDAATRIDERISGELPSTKGLL